MSAQAPVASPCIGVCRLEADGRCSGCLRTLAEIAAWQSMPEHERRHLVEQVLPQRAAGRGDG